MVPSMETLDAIHTRRSIRKFTDEKVSDELIEKILQAGMMAPSANNQQPWHFIVVKDKKLLDKITKIHKYSQMCKTASAAIIVCADTSCGEFSDFWIQDCSACTQNILLAIRDLGLGAVWDGLYPEKEYVKNFSEDFNLPKNIVPLSLVPLGYPAQKSGRVDRFKKERIHVDTW